MINKYTDPIITNYRFDKVGSRASVPITENLTINNGFLFLKEIPDRNNVVTIGNLIEVQKPEELDSETKFYIDYNAGIVYFDSKLNGTKVNVEYSGIGIVYYPASRIYLEADENHEIVRTLSDIEGQLSSLTNLKNQQERLKQEIEERNGDLNKTIEEAKTIDLSASIDKAKQANIELKDTTNKANVSKTQLDESKASADELNKNLLSNKNELATLDNSLKAENEKATRNISDLDIKSASGKQVIDDLNSATQKSETAKASLDESNTKAIQTNTELKATTQTANETKTSLEQLKNESSTLSNELSEGNTTASSNIESLKSENQNAKANITGLQTENQNALSKQETLSSETAKANEAITEITELITSSTDLKNKLEQIVASGDLDKYITDPKLREILTDYATKDDLSKIDVTSQLIDYAKKTEVPSNEKLDDFVKSIKARYYTRGNITIEYTKGSGIKNYINFPVVTQENSGLMAKKDKKKLNGIADGANKITKLSELENDTNFKTETEIQEMIANSSKLKKEVVDALPSSGEENVFYLIKDTNGKDNNNYLEYLWINGKWEFIGSTQVDLSGYAKLTDITTSKVISIYELDKDYWDALQNDTKFLEAVRKDTLTLVSFKGENYVDLAVKAGFETALYYKGQIVGVTPISFNSYEGLEKDIKEQTMNESGCMVTCGLLSGYNSTIQTQIKEISSAINDLSPFTQQELEEAFK